MLFITNPRLRKLEAFMQEVPHFPSKGAKVDFDSLEDEILLFEIENVIINVKPPNENLNIRKDNIMKFRNEKHRSTFLNEAKKQSLKNYKIISALYLLIRQKAHLKEVYVTCNINPLMYSPEKCEVKKKTPQEKRTCGKNTKHNKLKKVTSCSKIQANSHHDFNLMERLG